MIREASSVRAKPRCRQAWLWLCLTCLLSGCSFLANELSLFDRAGPVAAAAPATPSVALNRP